LILELAALLFSLTKPPDLAPPRLPPLWKASFDPTERAVDNWRRQAALDLDLSTQTVVRWLAGSSPGNLPRCIRLNNYWCIKKAGWPGEIASDAEGHVAFASAEEGAMVAVQLLRRYYLQYGRKSARAIVARWAPAQCEPSLSASGPQPAAGVRALEPASSQAPLARYGIGNTLRARWLAAHRRGAVTARKGKLAIKRSVVPDRLAPPRQTPTVALGIGQPEPPLVLEPPLKAERLRIASVAPAAMSRDIPLPPKPPLPVASCNGENLRLANYAARAIEGIASSPDDDLRLFDADGTPRTALPRLLANMAAVEIGPYQADGKLIEAAIEAVRNTAPGTAAARE
jgi:hypothetical protein